MLRLAHRGDHRHHPENTLDAFAAAASTGFDGVETDVRLAADGEAILYHNRLAPGGVPVAHLTRSELSARCGYTVPTLVEALNALPQLLWNIEIKTLAAAAAALPVLADYQNQRTLLVTSFRHDVVLMAARHLDVACGLLNAHRPAAINSLLHATLDLPKLRVLVWDFEILDETIIQQANALGFRNFVYGAHTLVEHKLALEYGCHGIISDHPQYLGLL